MKRVSRSGRMGVWRRAAGRRVGLLAAGAVLAVAAGGVFLASRSQAATNTVAAEAEQGTVAGAAAVRDTSATASGRFVTFGSASEPSARRSIKGRPLYVRTGNELAGRPRELTDYQIGRWVGDWLPDVAADVDSLVDQAEAADRLALIVAYNIPNRDCNGMSSGGAKTSAAYRAWIQDLARGIGNRPGIVVLEPDALAMTDCLDAAGRAARIADIAFATSQLRQRTQASVYIDAGHSNWWQPGPMADLLRQAGVAEATGFAINVSNYRFTAESTAYGDRLVTELATRGIPGTGYVVDTSRNGRGPAPDDPMSWCNPPGRGLGKRPTTGPDSGAAAHAFLWIKAAGESDGDCGRGEPPAGHWYPAYAQMLIDNAVY